jgi:SAM-dependent methyltransferase
MVSGAVAALALIRSDAYDPVIVRLPLPRIVRRALAPDGDIVAALRRVPLGSLGASAGIFAAMFLLVGVRSFCAFQLFGGSMNVVELVGISAAAFTLGSLSLLPMGLGVRDATLVALFVQAGADRDVAIAVAAFDRLLSTGVPLLLGILSAQILGLRAIPKPEGRKTSATVAEASESTSESHRQPRVRLGTHYRWVLTSSLWPPNGTAPRTLDVGCHNGFWLHQQAPGRDARVGCDLAPVASYADIHYVKCDGRSLPFASDTFELCTAWDVLEHVSDDRALLRELSRVLRPDGRVRLSVPHKHIAIFPPLAMPWLHRRWQHSIRTGYMPSEVRSLAEACGFAECTVIPLETPWFRRLYLVASLAWGLWPAAGRRLVTALARRDAAAGWGPKGVLLVELRKQQQPATV